MASSSSHSIYTTPGDSIPAVQAASPAAVQLTPATTGLAVAGVQVTADDASLAVRNTGSTVIDLAGWELRVGSQHATLPAGAAVLPGQSLTLHTASGTDTPTDIFLGARVPQLASGFAPGAAVELADPTGRAVVQLVVP